MRYGNYILNEITYHSVLSSLSTQDQLDLWSQVLGRYIRCGEVITNPLRSDRNPSCYLKEYNGIIFLCDLSYSKWYTIIHAVKELTGNIGLNHAARIIHQSRLDNKRLSFGISTAKSTWKKNGSDKKSQIIVCPYLHSERPAWTKRDREYWSKLGVSSKLLRESGVLSIHSFYVNDKLIYPKGLCYAYTWSNGHLKLYMPEEVKEKKFLSTTTCDDIFELVDFPPSENCIITKSMKDALTIKSHIPDIDVFSVQSEGSEPGEYYLNLWNKLYKHQIIIYDWDKAGKSAATKLSKKLSSPKLYFFPEELGKDASEVRVNYGENKLKELIWEFLLSCSTNG